MNRAFFLLMLGAMALTSCKSVSLGAGSEHNAGGDGTASGSAPWGGSGGNGGTSTPDAPVQGGQGGSGTEPCKGMEIPDFDCGYGTPRYVCVARGSGWAWDYTCPERPMDGGSFQQHPYVSTGAACINYPANYRTFPYNDPSIQYTNGSEAWPRCTRNCNTVPPVYGAALQAPLDQALPTGACDDEGATCSDGVLNEWCPPCADVGGPGNGYVCVCRGHNWHCSIAPNKGMNICGSPTCIVPSLIIPPPASCAKVTWTDTQICTCGVCRDLCDSDAQCPSGRCKLNQVCRPSDNCKATDECPAPCRGLCEPIPDGGTVDVAPAPGCDVAKAAQAVSAAGLTTVGEAQTLNVDLPSNLGSSANWGVKDTACLKGGYQLSPFAGKSVCLVSFGTTTVCQNQPTNAWVVMSDGIVRCIYQAVRPDSPMTPGIYSVNDAVCSTPDAAVPSCPDTNPAARTCRKTASECIPSNCTCASNGTWSCTTDCRMLSLCSTDGGQGDSPYVCTGDRIDDSRAVDAFFEYVRQTTPNMNPATRYGAEEKAVPNLWETMQAQLFFGKMYAEDGALSKQVAFLYRGCAVTLPTQDTTFGLIDSGVMANGAFYFSWGWGSGIYRSSLGKLSLDGATLVRTTSPAYFNPGSGPPGLVISPEDGQLVVYRATVYWGKFNEWSNPERMGLLKDFGDRLAIVDDNGKELSTTLP